MAHSADSTDIIATLRRRGSALNHLCQQLVALGATRQSILDVLEQRQSKWPTVANDKNKTLAATVRTWTTICVDIGSYSDSFGGSSQREAYVNYLRRVVLARVHLEATTSAADASMQPAAAKRVLSIDDAASSLRHLGYCIIDGALKRAGIDANSLRAELALLHKHGVIAPTNSSCNPGAHGINLRCGTEAERAAFDKQRTPTMRAAIELLRSLPHALQQQQQVAAQSDPSSASSTLLVPPTVLASAYPVGAKYSRHLDCYGDDNARRLTLILYANDDGGSWCAERDGGVLRLEERDGSSAVDVNPLSGRLVIFESKRIWHHVLPSRRLRFAITLWVYDDEDDDDDGANENRNSSNAPAGNGKAQRTAAPIALLARATDASGRTGYRWCD